MLCFAEKGVCIEPSSLYRGVIYSTKGYAEVNLQLENDRFRDIHRHNFRVGQVSTERGGNVVYISKNLLGKRKLLPPDSAAL